MTVMSTAIVLAGFVVLLAPFPLCVLHKGRPGARLAAEVEAWLRSLHGQ
jgi:hypothetical protein